MKSFVFLMACLLPLLASAKQKISLVTYPIPLFVESETKGVFIEFAHKLFENSGVDLDIVALPRNRALDHFKNKRSLILCPVVGTEFSGKGYLRTVKFYEKKDYLFFRKGDRYPTLKSLQGKVVGITLAYPYSQEALKTKGVIFEIASSDEANLKKLELKRIDAFLVEETTGLHALKNTTIKNITYDKDQPISILPSYFVFHDSPEGRKWHKFLNKRLAAVNKTQPLIESVRTQLGL